jgi:cytochrome c biogenesis protein ResB
MQRAHLNDVTWWVSPLFICTVLEIDIGLIICCMPVLPRLMKSVQETSSYAYARSLVRSRRTESSAKSIGSQEEVASEKQGSKEQLAGHVVVKTKITVDSQV